MLLVGIWYFTIAMIMFILALIKIIQKKVSKQ